MKPQVMPAIMPKNLEDIIKRVEPFLGVAEAFQLDIMDGEFVPALTWPFLETEEGSPEAQRADSYYHALISGEAALPFLSSVIYELDIMAHTTPDDLYAWMALQPTRIVLHLEALSDVNHCFEALADVRDSVEVGISFDDDFPIMQAHGAIDQADFVQLMGIDEIGKQNQDFEGKVIQNMRHMAFHYPDKVISIDGSVNLETIARLRDHGATRFVSGSAIYGSEDPVDTFAYMDRIARGES